MTRPGPVVFAAFYLALVAPAAGQSGFGDAEAGAKVFRKCFSCHMVGPDAFNRVGPHLNGIFGRRAGSLEGFKRYSDGLKRMGADGLFWDFDALGAYIENPKAFASDTRMNFDGLDDPQERADVLAYLRQFSASPANIPEAAPTAMPREVELSEDILALQGDKDYGEYLSSECTTCHQLDGDDQGIPAIIGWPSEDFVVAMHAYKEKVRPHPVMQMMAGRLSNEEIAALAAYFEGLE
ncbi:c-type cytochrome [Maritimibacter fusiformis]|uniref:C-type cytochrome n=1 Tax=Maritimibacter fusiformis TaxID=2603819 RepID=A0A5D0RKS1_9RHOB|nr:c-type cytochrome [Maritimibacter fusiformis]TYB81441.1 c-type cytochrome [Maritimibacter fusiformis]